MKNDGRSPYWGVRRRRRKTYRKLLRAALKLKGQEKLDHYFAVTPETATSPRHAVGNKRRKAKNARLRVNQRRKQTIALRARKEAT
jgi:hypothetical protein